jgi:hypothetical protein
MGATSYWILFYKRRTGGFMIALIIYDCGDKYVLWIDPDNLPEWMSW